MLDLYHGSNVKVDAPDVLRGRENLDFGKGFYLTVYRRQAESWAFKKVQGETDTAFLNIYQFDQEKIEKTLKENPYSAALGKDWTHYYYPFRAHEHTQ